MDRIVVCLILVSALQAVPEAASPQTVGEVEPAGAGLPLYRPAGSVAVLALATGTWLQVPTDSHDLLGAYHFLPPYATDDTRGQLFRLLTAEEGWNVADGQDRFVAVPWTVGCGCAEEGWDQPEWVPPGDTVTFLLSVTRRDTPWDGPPVYDVLGWHQPYPVGEFIPYWRWGRQEPRDWLTVTEFFDLLTILPSSSAFRLNPASSLEAVEGWLERNPDRSRAFPLPTILRSLRPSEEGR